MTTTFCSAHGLRDCAMCGPAVAAVTPSPAPPAPAAAEPQCTGPFADARSCPVHSKDIWSKVHGYGEPTAPLSASERKAAEYMAGVLSQRPDEVSREAVLRWEHAKADDARTPSPAPAATSTEPVACADCGHAWGVHYANGDMRCAQHDCACGGYSTAKPAPSREVPAWFVETYTKHYAQMAAEQAAARPVPSVEAPPARTIRQRIESTLDPEAMRRVRGIDGFKDMQVWALARLVFCVVDVLDERNAERAVSQ